MGPPPIPAKLDLTTFQRVLHGMSSKQGARRGTGKTKGAFGGVSKDERAIRSLTRRLGK